MSSIKLKCYIPETKTPVAVANPSIELKELQNFINNLIVDDDLKDKVELVWIDLAQLMDNKNFDNLFPEYKKGKEIIPKIFIGSQKIEDLYEANTLNHHKKINQLDNNICTFYLPLVEKKKFETKLTNILSQIKYNLDQKLYETNVVHEYYEYFRRMIKQNHLKGGHSSQLLPMVFTSESVMKSFAIENLNSIKPSIESKDIIIKILLVDDFGNENLKRSEEEREHNEVDRKNSEIRVCDEMNKGKTTSKGNILISRFNNFLAAYNKETKSEINITLDIKVLDSPKAVVLSQSQDVFDIILLDYNFNDNKNGVDFLLDIIKSNNPMESDGEFNNLDKAFYKPITGPFGKPWLIPISSFTTAFIDEMRNKQISFVGDSFEISRGADFINTPNLFFYYFTKMIKEIVKRATGVEDRIKKIKIELNNAKAWSNIEKMQPGYEAEFKKHIDNRKDINEYLAADSGILQSLKGGEKEESEFKKKMNFYEQLLYNLAYRNFVGNEEIIIFHDLLKNG